MTPLRFCPNSIGSAFRRALQRPSRRRSHARLALFALGTLLTLPQCTTLDRDHVILVSVPDQRMAVFYRGTPVRSYPVSTSKFGLGDAPDSKRTPLGQHRIEKKIGDGARAGAVFKDRKPTGEVLPPNAPGRDPIVTRILWLNGVEAWNRNSYERYIYIHGTPEERNLGTPASYGCIRMRSRDIIELYRMVGLGARVDIVNQPLPPLSPPPSAPGTGISQ